MHLEYSAITTLAMVYTSVMPVAGFLQVSLHKVPQKKMYRLVTATFFCAGCSNVVPCQQNMVTGNM